MYVFCADHRGIFSCSRGNVPIYIQYTSLIFSNNVCAMFQKNLRRQPYTLADFKQPIKQVKSRIRNTVL